MLFMAYFCKQQEFAYSHELLLLKALEFKSEFLGKLKNSEKSNELDTFKA